MCRLTTICTRRCSVTITKKKTDINFLKSLQIIWMIVHIVYNWYIDQSSLASTCWAALIRKMQWIYTVSATFTILDLNIIICIWWVRWLFFLWAPCTLYSLYLCGEVEYCKLDEVVPPLCSASTCALNPMPTTLFKVFRYHHLYSGSLC